MSTNRFNFRVWDKKNSRMWSGSDDEYYEYHINLRGEILSTEEYLDYDWYTITKYDNSEERFVLMQSTGLTDKNGKKIFEGDVIKITLDEGKPYSRTCVKKVTWDDKNYRFLFGGELINCLLYVFSEATMEVIGNIYENKELLED